jgi:transcription elongation factor GreA
MNRIPMTPEGFEQAKKQLDHLKYVEMPRVQKALQEARELGDLSENAEFDAARSELWNLDQRITEMETKISLAEIIDPKTLKLDTIAIGALVKVEEVGTRRKDEFMLVGEGEQREGVDTVSVTSPLGSAFIGKKAGDIAEVQAPRGLVKYKVVSFKF